MSEVIPSKRPQQGVRNLWQTRAICLGAGCLAGLVVAVAAPAWLTGIARAVAGYDAAAIVIIVAFFSLAMETDHRATATRAAREDPGRNVMFTIVMTSGLVGLASAVSILGAGPHVPTASERGVTIALALLAVVAGWVLIHTTFTFRYAHLYYYDADGDSKADRGLAFPGSEPPNDYDFAYFSFVIGMTFQVSDVSITHSNLRRLTLAHSLISFAYNTAIIALVINIASGLLHS